MIKFNQRGSSSVLLISIVTLAVLFIGALIFGLIEFSSAQNYKNNTDQIVANQIKIAVDKNSSQKDNEFAEAQKSPLKTYQGPETYGNVTIKYPKSWSAYIDTSSNNQPVDGYFHPNFVPGTSSSTAFALRLQVSADTYDQEMAQFTELQQSGEVKVSPFRAAKVQNVLGARIDGKIAEGKQGTLIILPIRDKTLKIWTESNQFSADFSKYILPNLTFSP